MNGGPSVWAISPEERTKHDQKFDTLSPTMGYVSGEQAKKFFLQSGLPASLLAEIWTLADISKDGKMDRLEFSIAMKLIKLRLQGTPLPSALPIIMKQPPVSAPSLNPNMASMNNSRYAGLGSLPNLSMMPGTNFSMLTPISVASPGLSPMTPMAPMTPLSSLGPTATGLSPMMGSTPTHMMGSTPTHMMGSTPNHLMHPMGTPTLPNGTMGFLQPIPAGAAGLSMSSSFSSPGFSSSPAAGINKASSLLDLGSSSSTSNSLSPSMMSSMPPGPSDWAVPHASRLKYRQQFNSLDKQMTGYLTGQQVRSIMAATMLNQTQLASIWTLADVDKDGKLKAEEFILAMHLVDMTKSGYSLPMTLPNELVPPSCRTVLNGSSPSLYAALTDETDLQPPQKTKTNMSFEDKFKANLDRGNAELEKRRQVLQEAQRREEERRAEKEREEREKREREAREAEEKRRKEEERRLERQREMERQKEEEKQREIERKEAAQRELERQRKEEWERRRRGELKIKREQEQDDIIRLKAKKKSLEMELEEVGNKHRQISDQLRGAQNRKKVQKVELDLTNQRRESRQQDIDNLQRQLEEFQRKLSQLTPEQRRLTEKLRNMALNNLPVSSASSMKMIATEKKGACRILREQLEGLEKETAAKLAQVDQYNKDMQELKESQRKQQATLEHLRHTKEEKRRELERKREQEEEVKRREEERRRQEEERKREDERKRKEEEEAQRRIKLEKDRLLQEKLRREEEERERKRREEEERESKRREEEERERKRREEEERERKRREEEERQRRLQEDRERRAREDEEKRRREVEEERKRQDERKKLEQERRELEEERRKLEEERKKEEKRRLEEEERHRREEERKRLDEERREEERRREREEEERRRERAASAAVRDAEERRKGEEEERRKREEEDRRKREEEERRKRVEEEKKKREEERRAEEERRRQEEERRAEEEKKRKEEAASRQQQHSGGKSDITEKLSALLRGLEERRGGLQPRATEHRKSASLTSFKALYPFSARNQEELSFNAEDIIEVDETTEREMGWLYGSYLGKMGWFPESYVERLDPVDATDKPKLALKPQLSTASHNNLEAAMATGAKSAFTPTHSPNPTHSEGQGQVVGTLLAQALCSWTAKTDSHLNFSKDDVIRVLEQQESWCLGELNGAQGWFPKTYVTMLGEEESTDPMQSLPDGTESIDGQQGEEYVALYTYESPEAGDLTFREGDVVLVSQREGEWWSGSIGDRTGVFPSNYVKPKDSDTSSVSGKKKPEIAQVTSAYSSTGTEQLVLAPGQLILVLNKNPSGWWLGELQARGKKRQKGWFPASHVKMLGSSSGKSTPAPLPVCQVIAMYDYTAANKDEMSFSKGQLINVMDKNDPDWWKGEMNGVTGLFPTNYVKVTTAESDPSQQWW